MTSDNKIVHFTAGAVSGTLGSIITCPLDVAKTRLQSSKVDTYRPVDKNINKNEIGTNGLHNKTINKIRNNFFENIKSINKNFKNTNSNEKIKNNVTFKRTYSTMYNQQRIKDKASVKNKPFIQNKLNIQHRLKLMSTLSPSNLHNNQSIGFINCIRHIVNTEGYRALFKGLMPTLFGVAPARAIYFTTYEHCKKTYSSKFVTSSPSDNSNTYQHSLVHLLSAASAGITCTTLTNPIWMIRTRLQLNNKSGDPLTTLQCIKNIHQQHGLRGFYKGLTASYFGVTETAIHFVIYEAIKANIVNNREKSISNNIGNTKCLSTMSSDTLSSTSSLKNKTLLQPSSSSSLSSLLPSETSSSSSDTSSSFKTTLPMGAVDGDEEDFLELDTQVLSQQVPPIEFLKYMLAASVSKTIATFLAYPHEVARTRMREGNPKYTTFFGTLLTVAREEGTRAMYRGLVTQLIKHIPNTAIVLTTYEAVVYLCNRKGF